MLALDAVTKRFGGLTAVREVSLRAAPGEIVGIIGPNGAGKTTLFNVISGFYAPDEGRVLLDGRDVSRVPAHRICALGLRSEEHTSELQSQSNLVCRLLLEKKKKKKKTTTLKKKKKKKKIKKQKTNKQ